MKQWRCRGTELGLRFNAFGLNINDWLVSRTDCCISTENSSNPLIGGGGGVMCSRNKTDPIKKPFRPESETFLKPVMTGLSMLHTRVTHTHTHTHTHKHTYSRITIITHAQIHLLDVKVQLILCMWRILVIGPIQNRVLLDSFEKLRKEILLASSYLSVGPSVCFLVCPSVWLSLCLSFCSHRKSNPTGWIFVKVDT
jgi:hypothetical protein